MLAIRPAVGENWGVASGRTAVLPTPTEELQVRRMRNVMTPAQLRTTFRGFAGSDRVRRFVVQLRGDAPEEARPRYPTGRGLRYWQEELWDQFADKNDDVPLDLEAIREAMLWCDIHDLPFEIGRAIPDRCGVTGRDGERLDDQFEAALESEFRFGFGFWNLVCPQCVVECDRWMTERFKQMQN